MDPRCHPAFSSCAWTEPADNLASNAVFSGCLVISIASLFSLISGITARWFHLGLSWNLVTEGAVGALFGSAVHVVLFLALVVQEGANPFPLWLTILLWTLPFILTARSHFMTLTVLCVGSFSDAIFAAACRSSVPTLPLLAPDSWFIHTKTMTFDMATEWCIFCFVMLHGRFGLWT
jgi:hypothetical protein